MSWDVFVSRTWTVLRFRGATGLSTFRNVLKSNYSLGELRGVGPGVGNGHRSATGWVRSMNNLLLISVYLMLIGAPRTSVTCCLSVVSAVRRVGAMGVMLLVILRLWTLFAVGLRAKPLGTIRFDISVLFSLGVVLMMALLWCLACGPVANSILDVAVLITARMIMVTVVLLRSTLPCL